MTVAIHMGDCRDVLRTLPDESVHCVVTSPPYWGLRDYQTAKWEGGDAACDHSAIRRNHNGEKQETSAGTSRDRIVGNDCAKCGAIRIDSQIGLEPDFRAYVAAMVGVFREVRRVLRSDGTLWLNLGDSYATGTSSGRKPTTAGKHGYWENPAISHRINGAGDGLKPKDLCGIPWRVAFALQEDGWYLRQDCIWSKSNPMPESVTDRCTKAHEYLFLLSKSERYYFDQHAIAEPNGGHFRPNNDGVRDSKILVPTSAPQNRRCGNSDDGTRNKRSVWEVATAPFSEAHFATFPPALIEPCIKAGTSERGCCAKCGAPWRRNTASEFVPQQDVSEDNGIRGANNQKPMDASNLWQGFPRGTTKRETLGWSPSCKCFGHFEECDGPEDWISKETGERRKIRVYVPDTDSPHPVPATVLDPFAGAGTTGLVADRLQRSAILIELNPDYSAMSERRIVGDAPLFVEVRTDNYNATDDFAESIDEAYRVIRERKAAGGKGWEPP